MKKLIYIGFVLIFGFKCLAAQPSFQTKVLASGLGIPWDMEWGGDGNIWFTERQGRISRMDPATGSITIVKTFSDCVSQNEGGMLGLALHPDFANNPYLYVVYDYMNGSNYREKMVRFKYVNGELTEPKIFIDNIPAYVIHNGSRLLIDSKNYLYMTTGDASIGPNAQDLNSLSGKLLRFNLDGTRPVDNPFNNSFIWSYGHRNAQGLVEANGIIYSSEHGPNNDDELNIIIKGRNYGWPNVHGFCDKPAEMEFCISNNIVEPIAAWTPTLAVCGLDYYNDGPITEFKKTLLLTTLKASKLVAISLSPDGLKVTDQKVYLEDSFGRLRDVIVSPNGKVYISTSNSDGNDKIIELSPKGGSVDEGTNHPIVYPNPSFGSFHIDKDVNESLKIYNEYGTLVYSNNSKDSSFMIDAGNLMSGVYFITLFNGAFVRVAKIALMK